MPARDPWLDDSPFEYKIKVTLGTYLTVFSDPFLVQVNDSCAETQLIPEQFPTQFAPVFALTLFDFAEIQDTLSEQYSGQFGDGSGNDLCGPKQYLLLEEVGGNLVVPSVARLAQNDQTLVEMEPTESNQIGLHKMVLQVTMRDYAPTLSIDFNIVVTGC